MLNQFYVASRLCPNSSKCEVAGISSLKDALMKVGTQRTKKFNTIKESTKIFNLHISYNKKFQDDINFCTAVKNIYNVAKLCRMRDLYLEVKITTFKSLNI